MDWHCRTVAAPKAAFSALSALRRPSTSLLLAFAVTGCSSPLEVSCTSDLKASVAVLAVDSVSQSPINSGATLIVRDGLYADSTSLPSGRPDLDRFYLSVESAWERVGRYDITVRRAGYADWSRSGVRVTADRCHVRTVYLTALLQPAS